MKKKVANNISLKILSLIIAVVVWLLVVNIDNPIGTKSFVVSDVQLLNEAYIDADGKMFVPDTVNGKRAIVAENGKLYFTIDGVKMVNGLYELDGAYYFARYDGTLVTNGSAYVETTELSGNGWYGFGADGKLIMTGFVIGNGKTYYYADGVRAKGLTKIGEDYYFFNAGSGMMYKDANMWVPANSYGVEPGMHYFGADGKMAQTAG